MTVREGRDVNIECVVLDAMGVVFRAADDVAELLVPFVRNRGGVEDVGAIEAAYLDASRGSITADAFWLKVGLSPSLEDDYLSGHALTPGAREFLAPCERHECAGVASLQRRRALVQETP